MSGCKATGDGVKRSSRRNAIPQPSSNEISSEALERTSLRTMHRLRGQRLLEMWLPLLAP